MTAYEFEYEFAKQDGVEFRWLVAPTRIIAGADGKVSGLELVRMELGEPDAKGRKKPSPIKGSEFSIEVDYVVKAIGQERHLKLVEQFGLAHDRGIPVVDPSTYQTSRPHVFAAGDLIFGGGKHDAMVVEAAQQGKEVAHALHSKWQQDAKS
jgi:glutamate synthase (NADPH/NADH) small chain